MPRYHADACSEGCEECASVCPTHAIEARDRALAVDYGRCIVCNLCTEACPTGAMEPSNDWAFGVRERADLVWSETRKELSVPSDVGAQGLPAQPAHPPCRRRLLQRMRIRAAGSQQSLLQSAPPRDFLHAHRRASPTCFSSRGRSPTRCMSRSRRPTTPCRSRDG